MVETPKTHLTCGLCLLTVGLAVVGTQLLRSCVARALFSPFTEGFDPEQEPWIGCRIPLPEAHGAVVFLRRSIHPFLAEYDRRICFGDDPASGTLRSLPVNCGGRTRINAYWYAGTSTGGPYLKLQDHWGVYIVDLRRKVLCLMDELDGVPYIGDIPADSDGRTSSGWSKEYGGTGWQFSVEGRPGHRATGVLIDSAGLYIGRIDECSDGLTFISVDEAPEEKIDMVRPVGQPPDGPAAAGDSEGREE